MNFWRLARHSAKGARVGVFLLAGLAGVAVPADAGLEGTNLWTLPLESYGGGHASLSSPAVAPDGTIYVGTFGGTLLAVAPDGKPEWRFATRMEIRSSPAVADDGTIYFGGRDRRLYALTPAGKLKWKFTTGAWVDSTPAIAVDGTVYFGSWDKNFYALHPDGSLKWKYAAGGIVDSSPAIAADGTIYFGAHNGIFYALDAGGKPRWTFATASEITSSPALGADGSVYFSSTDGNLYCLKADGTAAWRCRTGGGSDGSPVLADNGNIVVADGQLTLMISPAGAIVWSWGPPDWADGTPAVGEGVVCLMAPWHRVWAIKPDGKAESWTVSTLDNVTSSPIIGNHGEIYVCSGNFLLAAQPPVPLLPAKSSWPMFHANARHNGRVGSN